MGLSAGLPVPMDLCMCLRKNIHYNVRTYGTNNVPSYVVHMSIIESIITQTYMHEIINTNVC